MRTSSAHRNEHYKGRHRAEHWYRNNTVYFITARCRDGFPAFRSDAAKAVFWDRFNFSATAFGFTPWVTTLLDTHYHTVGYLSLGTNLSSMMRRFHGSVAKLVNDTLEVRLLPFWGQKLDTSYFDGCLRDELQSRRAYRYMLMQAVRARIVTDWNHYPHTRIGVELEDGLKFALESKCFLPMVGYKRYET